MTAPPPTTPHVPMSEALEGRLLDLVAQGHPRPWTIDQDWSATVLDARGEPVMSAPLDVAQELVFLIQERDRAMAEVRTWIARELGDEP